ncbi:MAG: hypothetical protein DBW97_03640 [SAR86 cluster bacterium]|uniref:Lipoprotein n=1 Tax=SAR86 cluster bacterium TaxID=2030880 RepID=A0A368BLF0_9GAMM|nr:MAG: hypothetical protein DBW97_03640 [SAR86 cluster bacterium]|tara:strand:+ start:936 stop:1532 length:597 start_codon:yes stop_codon:yes gene_type:complete
MLIPLLQSFLLILLISCSSEFDNTSNVVKIDDSYFFQKEKYNISFFSCDQPQNQLANIRSTTDYQHFIEISTIDSQELDIEGCTRDTFALNELTPKEGNPFANEFLIDISECKTNVDIFNINEVFAEFLNLTADLSTFVWHGVSDLDNDNFYWVNLFKNNEHRNEVLNAWTSDRNSGLIAKQLKSVGYCSIPKLYYFP